MESQGHIRSSSSSSSSSFDSCSDLLGSLQYSSAHRATPLEAQQQEDARSKAVQESERLRLECRDSKQMKGSQDGSTGLALDKDGQFVEGLMKQVLSSQAGGVKSFEGEEAMLRVEAHNVKVHNVKEDAEGFSTPITANKAETLGDNTFEKGSQISTPTCPLQPRQLNASESLVNFANDRIGVENNKDVMVGSDHEFQGHADTSNIGERISSVSETDHDLQQLENSIKFFDLHKTNSILPHPLRSLSRGCDRPDLEKVDEQIDESEVVYRNQSYARSMSAGAVTKNRKFAAGPEHHNGKELNSASMLSWQDSEEARIVHQGCKQERDDSPSSANKPKSDVIVSADLGADTSAKPSLVDWKEETLAQSLDGKEGRSQSLVHEELFGRKGGWKLASLEKKIGEPISWESEDLGPDELFRYLEALDVNETYVDTILDTEDVVFNFDESRGRFSHAVNNSTMGTHHPSGDGSLSSSTYGLQMFSSYCTLSAKDIPFAVDWVEVVGARQKRGGSSVWERMVGVKDHTVYCIKVVSGNHEWEVLRRYRDFVDFYHQLKRIFNARTGGSLPPPSEEVESEARKVFGNISPNVVEVRSFRIERCLQSLLQAGPPFSTTPPLFWFLRPPQGAFAASSFEEHLMIGASSLQKGLDVQLGSLDSPQLHSPPSDIGSSKTELDQDRSPFNFGKTIKLVLNIHPNKSFKQLLYAQHHSCAGCYKHLDLEKGIVQGFAQTLGRGKPRLCEYSGQLFCSSCHLNEFAVLPAHVLRRWDFMPRRVSQLAKAYLDSIYDQPLLCVGAVNPYLYSRVPILCHVKETRTKLSRVLSCMRCPSRARIQQTMGSRRYLFENNDFFALRDLEDLSKGAFAALPGLLTAVLENLKMHVTKQCSVCQDTGEWCGAGILCEDPFNPIFPFQEQNVTNCKICNAPFHSKCFVKCSSCPSCPKDWIDNKAMQASERVCTFEQEEQNNHDHMTM